MPNIDVYAPGRDITARASATVTTGRFVAITGNRPNGGPISVAHATAAGRTAGVARDDANSGELLTIARGNSRVVLVKTAGTIAAGAEVEVGANGQAVTKTAGIAVGYALTGAASGANAEISLY